MRINILDDGVEVNGERVATLEPSALPSRRAHLVDLLCSTDDVMTAICRAYTEDLAEALEDADAKRDAGGRWRKSQAAAVAKAARELIAEIRAIQNAAEPFARL